MRFVAMMCFTYMDRTHYYFVWFTGEPKPHVSVAFVFYFLFLSHSVLLSLSLSLSLSVLSLSVESICITSGLGFNGYDGKGEPRWDLTKTIDPLAVEFGTNPRQMVLAWNVGAQTWLRRFLFYLLL